MLGQRSNQMTKLGLVFGIVLAGMTTLASAGEVVDKAKFFSPEAIEKANRAISSIEKSSGLDIQIETYPTVPADKAEALARMDREEKQELIRDWTKERAKALKHNGALILICKDPARIESWFSGSLRDRGFSRSDRDAITMAIVSGFKSKNYDEALTATIGKIGSVYSSLKGTGLRSSLRPSGSTPPPPPIPHRQVIERRNQMSWTPVIWVVGLVLFGIFVISMLSRLFGGGSSQGMAGPGQYGRGPGYGGYGGYGGGGGGGGFLSGLAGGLFGAAAGHWLYDSFSGRSAHAQELPHSQSDPMTSGGSFGDDNRAQDAGWSDEGSSTGGGWFDSGDGGDFGSGGDFGDGGDFGSGDSF
ncbi:TPM domain-containing protein [Schlesneria sp. DSM 10557]|uniref:TPM domain-containing protein n=1 Tax=Schlesneria sp. DSM 10557 TaxID=3044399 RepID=UPI0035A1C9F8